MDLFQISQERNLKHSAPLADRMRPQNFSQFVGQQHLIGENKPLFRLLQQDHIHSMIFYGPPGTGKTSLAEIIARQTRMKFRKLSAVTSGIKEIREMIEMAKTDLGLTNQKTILFIDEIHRFNKTQQDALLPHVERGLITLIGATTENPYFSVNKALLSRCQVLSFHKIESADIDRLLREAIQKDVVLSQLKIKITDQALDYLVTVSGGDARSALNALEITVLSTEENPIEVDHVKEAIQIKSGVYDRDGDSHFDTASAFIKSIRGSDVDAALYYLAVMIEAGEDPRFIARRIMISAAEDIGLANPQALSMAVAAHQAVERIGMPEGRIILSQAVIYCALSPKSNSAYLAIDQAIRAVHEHPNASIPYHLKDTHYKGASDLGHGLDYIYPHDHPSHFVVQEYLPKECLKEQYYRPTDMGEEMQLKKYYQGVVKEKEKRSEDLD